MLHYTSEMPTDIPWRIIKDITNDFSEERQIGRGGYGAVYKGVHADGHVVAVKKLYHMPGLDEMQFQSEIRNLVGLHHPNIVHLVGKSYLEQDRCVEYNGRLVVATMIDRAICLEYVPNGNLEKHLYDEFSGFSWSARYKIIKGICKGLEYLHQRRMFHLDLKPANILLDQDLLPKIADFGLSRLFSGTRQSHTTNKFIGTIGYVPPEYIEKGKISEKFDVFSLGVIIIKFLTGPDAYGTHSDSSSEEFIELVHENWRKRLEGDGLKDASYLDALCQQVKTCIEMALNCVQTDRHKRPSIRDIIRDMDGTETTLGKPESIDNMQLQFTPGTRQSLEKSSGDFQGKQDGSSSRAVVTQPGFPPASSSSQTEKQPYRLVIKEQVGTKDENFGGYYVVIGEPISVQVTLMKSDDTLVGGDDPFASKIVELVVLPGNFYDPLFVRSWTKDHFDEWRKKMEVQGMTVESSTFQLNDGKAVHNRAKIIKNSSKQEVKLGVMIHESDDTNIGRRVIEGVSNAFRVKQRQTRPKNAAKCLPGSTTTEESHTPGSSSQPTLSGKPESIDNIQPQLTPGKPQSQLRGSSEPMSVFLAKRGHATNSFPTQNSQAAPIRNKRGRTIQSQNHGQLFEGSSAMETDLDNNQCWALDPVVHDTGDHDPRPQDKMMGHAQNAQFSRSQMPHLTMTPATQHGQLIFSNNAKLQMQNPLSVVQGPAQSAKFSEPLMSHPSIPPTAQHGQLIYNNNAQLPIVNPSLGAQGPAQSAEFSESLMSHPAITHATPHGNNLGIVQPQTHGQTFQMSSGMKMGNRQNWALDHVVHPAGDHDTSKSNVGRRM